MALHGPHGGGHGGGGGHHGGGGHGGGHWHGGGGGRGWRGRGWGRGWGNGWGPGYIYAPDTGVYCPDPTDPSNCYLADVGPTVIPRVVAPVVYAGLGEDIPPPTGAMFTCKDGSKTPNPTTCPEWGQTPSAGTFEGECWAPHKSTLLGIYALCFAAGAAVMHVAMKKGWH